MREASRRKPRHCIRRRARAPGARAGEV